MSKSWITLALGICAPCQGAMSRSAYVKRGPACAVKYCFYCKGKVRAINTHFDGTTNQCNDCERIFRRLDKHLAVREPEPVVLDHKKPGNGQPESDQIGSPPDLSDVKPDGQVVVHQEEVLSDYDSLGLGSSFSLHRDADAAAMTKE